MVKLTRILTIAASVVILLTGYLPAVFAHEVQLSCPTAFGPAPDESGLIAYYPLDGNTADVTGNGMDAIEVNAVNPVEGKLGQGYHFNGKDSFMRMPLNISPEVYPQITVTAWIKPEDLKSARYVVTGGDHSNISLFVSHGAVSAGGTVAVGDRRHTIYENRWVFVALSYDHTTNTAVLLSDASITAADATIPEQHRPSVLLGAKAPGNSVFAGTIDEVRFYNRVLTTTELAGLRRSTGAPTRSAASQPGVPDYGDTPTQGPGSQIATTDPLRLPGDQFEGMNPAELPGAQLPSVGESSGAGSTTPLQGVQDALTAARRDNTDLARSRISRPDLGSGPEGSACSNISAAGGLAGRWQMSSSPVGVTGISVSAFSLTVEFYGPDSNLSGHIRAMAESAQIDVNEPLSSVSLTGSTVRFSSPSLGEVAGEVSGDGLTIIGDNLALGRVACGSEFAASSGPGNVMAGYWRQSESTGVSSVASEYLPGYKISSLAFDFTGPDSILSGRLVMQGLYVVGPLNQEEPLTNIVKNGSSISFSSAPLGNMTGEVSDDGTEMTLPLSDWSGSDSIVFSKQ